jgi:hypothetical protein
MQRQFALLALIALYYTFQRRPPGQPAFEQAAHKISTRRTGVSPKEQAMAGNGNQNALTMRLTAKIRACRKPGGCRAEACCAATPFAGLLLPGGATAAA